jgi:lysozyme family protein
MRSNYPAIQSWIGLSEGGYVSHPDDPGGATDRGITQATFDAWNRMHGQSLVAVRGISKAEAEAIIAHQYLDKVGADLLPSGLDYCAGDYAVNSGVAWAATELQRVLGVTVDGIVGAQTIAAANGADIEAVIAALCARRMRFLQGLRTWHTFGAGWSVRVIGPRAGAQVADCGVLDRATRLARAAAIIPAPVHSAPAKARPADRSGIATFLSRFFNAPGAA